MNWLENLIIVAGISLELFAAMESQGSLVARVDKKHLCQICGFVAVWQMAAALTGYLMVAWVYQNERAYDERFVGIVMAAVILFAAGIRLLVKAVKNERVQEHLERHLDFKKFVHMAAVGGIHMLLAGTAFGCLSTQIWLMLSVVATVTVAVIVLGMYTGYYLGFRHKAKAYIGGAVLLWIAGLDLVVGHIIW